MSTILHSVKKFIPTKIFNKLRPVYHLSFAWLAAFFYRHPSNKLIVIGVTGTTGKTTTVYLTAKMLESAGYKVGYTSTAMFKVAEREWLNDKKMTMLGRFFTQSMLARMVKAGCHYAIIETTSEGIEQFRHRFINYDTVLITGLYPEHIEAHGSFANYKKAKGKLFTYLSTCAYKYVNDKNRVQNITEEIKKIHCEKVPKTIIVNGDDEHAEYFASFKADQKLIFGRTKIVSPTKEYLISQRDVKGTGISFAVEDVAFRLQIMGAFNLYNALASVSIGISQQLDLHKIKTGLQSVSGVPGRFERIDEGQDFTVVVDYAFEPKALSKLYETIGLIKHGPSDPSDEHGINKHGASRIINVLGSTGGGRDISRRGVLGKIAGKNADVVIVTNEDPYDDDPEIIIDQVALGVEKEGKKNNKNLFKILDRREAIRKALSMAQSGDVVLITGKGSEQAICITNGEKIPWDDRRVVREELNK